MASAYVRRCLAGLPGICRLPLVLAALSATASPAAALPGQPVATASASRWTLPPANLTKRSALLGGQSRMEQILVGQGSPVRTASLSGFRPTVAGLTSYRPPEAVSVAGAPNVFGSVALPVSRTPLDAQWRRANANASTRQLAGFTTAFRTAGGDREAQLEQVNAWVNRRLAFTDDARIDGRADRWTGAAESLRRGRGDCEDYALAKMQLLEALGYDGDRMYLVVARDLFRRADHAVLVVELEGRLLVLDNNTDTIVESSAVSDYRPIMSYSAGGRRWVHGYAATPARETPPIQIASSVMAAVPSIFASIP